MKPFRTKWASAPAFAEVAETLRVPTDRIMAALLDGSGGMVLYTPEAYVEGEDPRVFAATLKRDDWGILRVLTRHEVLGMWQEVTAAIERRLNGLEKGGEK